MFRSFLLADFYKRNPKIAIFVTIVILCIIIGTVIFVIIKKVSSKNKTISTEGDSGIIR